MHKIAFIYPGQGAQKAGMGKEFYEEFQETKNVFDMADEVLDFDIKNICFEENELLNQTSYTQPALVTTSIGITKVLKKHGILPDMTAGLSLGAYAALEAAGVMTEKEAIGTVRQRGIFMEEAVPEGGAMAAVLGMQTKQIENVLSDFEEVSIANYNCPGQIVITGMEQELKKAAQALKEAGAKRVIELKVSGPFHSKYLMGAGEKLKGALRSVSLQDAEVPYVSNIDAAVVYRAKDIKARLVRQVYSPVLWQQSVEEMIRQGIDLFVEIGPGKTLGGFMRKINSEVLYCSIQKPEDIEKLKVLIEGE